MMQEYLSGRLMLDLDGYSLSDEEKIILESLISFRRAGADAILTYFALEVARLMK